MPETWDTDGWGDIAAKPFLSDALEFYYHDPELAYRLEIMGYYRLTPEQVECLDEEELFSMIMAMRLNEQKQNEALYDVIGSLTGTSWTAESLMAKGEEVDENEFTWKLRPKKNRISLPLTVVVGGNKILEHVKKIASNIQLKNRAHPSVLNLPPTKMLKDTEIVDLSNVSKEEFLRFANRVAKKG